MGMQDNNERAIMKSASRKPVIIATIAAAILLAITGAGHRVLVRRLEAMEEAMPLPPGALQRLPMKIGDWLGQDVELDLRIVMTDTGPDVNRRYLRNNGDEEVSLYIAYGVRIRDMMFHRPEVAYPCNGWTLEDRRLVNLPLPDGTELQCHILDFSRSGLSTDKITVLNYYIVDGAYCTDVSSLLRGKILGGTGYVAQMQISCLGNGPLSSKSSDKIVSAFAVDSTRAIYDLFPRSDDDLRNMWALFDNVMAEYKVADPKGYAELMESA